MNGGGPKVVLLSPEAQEIDRWSAVLEGADVRAVASLEGLAKALAVLPADVVVAPCDARLLEGIQRCRGDARLVLCGSVLPLGVVDAAGQGYELRHVERESQLRREVYALARPRSLMIRHQLAGLAVRWTGAERALPLLDISNGGFSFRLELDGELEQLLPGTLLCGVEVRRGPALALCADAAVVRYVEQATEPGTQAHYRIGCEVSALERAQAPARSSRFTDGATRAGLLREALRGSGILLQGQGPSGSSGSILCTSGKVEIESAELAFDAPLSTFEPYDVVRGSFELGGTSYSFVTSAISGLPLRLRLPSAIEGSHRRGSARYRPDGRDPVSVLLTAPLLAGQPLEREVLEISSTGLSFALDPAFDLFPPGMRLSRVELRLPGLTFACSGSVRNLAPLGDGTRGVRCGVSFEGLDAAERDRLADALMRQRYPGLGDGSALPLDELFRFFQETRFLYPEKLAALGPMLPEVRKTFARLHAKPSSVFKSLVYLEDGKPLAHGSSVRVYRRTVVLQHLAGTSRLSHRPPPQVLNLGLAEYLAQSIDLEYLKFYFRPDNKWPSRVFGNFARKISDRQLSDLRTFAYFALPTGTELPTDGQIRVVEAAPGDLSLVEQYFVANARGLLLRSDDLTRGALPLAELNASFGELGLVRRRTVLLALRGDEPVGFALCEITSPGMNLSELFSSFRIHLLPAAGGAEDPRREGVWLALAQASLRLYRQNGRPLAVGLFEEGEAAARILPALGKKRYTCWTVHRSLCPRFCEYVDRLYEMLTQGRRKREAGNDDVSHGERVRGDAA
jgi:hypothetical protein